MKIFLRALKLYIGETIFIRKISKGHKFANIVGGILVLVLCTSSDNGLYLFQVS